ncbi:MAG: hypothetical protein IJJ82_05250 [Clostridia bacterium]|nr:hypothetical protein [Clostridia bacterium]
MKKKKILINFIIFGSILTVAVLFANLISLLSNGKDISTEFTFRIEYVIVFLFGGTIFTIMRYLAEKFTKKDSKKVVFLKSQIIVYAILLAISILLLIISIYKSIVILKIFSIAFIIAISLYELGLNLTIKGLKKDVEKINKKLKENKLQ